MRFDDVHAMVPYEHEGDIHSKSLQIYREVRVKYPGKHALDTDPIGGDFVVEVECNSAGWSWKQFTHGDIFKDVEDKTLFNPTFMKEQGIVDLARVVKENSLVRTSLPWDAVKLPGLRYNTFLRASQVLAVAEHRRYHRFEKGGGGRFLPLRFSIGIVYGHWTAQDAIRVQRTGVHGLRSLCKDFGNPPTVKAILDGTTAKSY